MKHLQPIRLAIEQARAQRDQALAHWQKMRQQQQFAQGQMQQLQDYAVETDHRWALRAQHATIPELLQAHVQFATKLEHAITLQKDVLAQAAGKVEAAQAAVVRAEQRLTSFQQLLARREHELARAQQRREQKQMDEWATQRALLRTPPTQEPTS